MVLARRSEQPWADSFRLYVVVAIVIVVMRVLFRVLLGGGVDGGQVLLDLPEIPLPDWVLGLHLLGPVTRESVLAGLYDGLRLATIVDLRRRGQRAGQPQAAAPLGAGGAARGRHRPGRRGHGAAAAGRQRPPGAGGPGAARG